MIAITKFRSFPSMPLRQARGIMARNTALLFHPIGFAIFFLATYCLYGLGLANSTTPPVFATTIYVCTSMAMYLLGAGLGSLLATSRLEPAAPILSPQNARSTLLVLYAVAVTAFLLEHVVFIQRFGTIPILLPDFEIKRFEFPINGYIHLIAYMNYIFLYTLIVQYHYLHTPNKAYVALLLLFCICSMVLDLCVGNRASSIGFLATICIALSFKYNFKRRLLFYSCVLFIAFGVFKLIRDYAMYGDAVYYSVANDWTFGGGLLNASLYYIYMGLAYNFHMLNQYVIHLDKPALGFFSIAMPFLELGPGAQYSKLDFQRDTLGIDYHGTLTATMLSIPYFDFLFGGIIVIGIIGITVGFVYYRAQNTRQYRFALTYGYLYWMTILGVYTYMFDKFYILANLAFLWIIGSITIDPTLCRQANNFPCPSTVLAK